ncbi:MAG: alpha/beta fold hydrolase [Spirochaetales bacterium]
MKIKNLLSLPVSLKTDLVGQSLFLEGGREAVLLIHGYTGITDELSYFAWQLHSAGYTVSVPRLPGHGTCGEDFQATGATDWYRKVVDTYADLRAKYSVIHWAGLSMGGLLALLGAVQFEGKSLILAAPALKVYDWRLSLTPFLRYIFKRREKKEYIFEGIEEYRNIALSYWRYNWPVQASELLKLQRLAIKALPRYTGKLLILLGGKDDTVPPSVSDLIRKKALNAKVEAYTFTQSGHVVLNGEERAEVAEKVVKWLTAHP